MSWFSINLDLLLRTCFTLETESQSSEQKKTGAQLNPLNASKLNKEKDENNCTQKDCHLNASSLPSPSEKTESMLSFSTIASRSSVSSSIIAQGSKCDSALPSYLDSSICRKRRHRRETSQNDVLHREGFEILGILSSGRFGSSLLARCKNGGNSDHNTCSASLSSSSEHKVVTLNTYHKAVLSETYQQHIPNREKELLESFDHPFISTVLGTFSDRNSLYLVSPLETGGPLSHLLQNALSFGITDKMKTFYAACVLSVLKYAHGQNIIHRGLHSDSLLIDSKGYLKVTDWGFAKVITDRTYTLCGHVEYLCPEAIAHESGYGKGADYWAFGVLIYDMFVGRSAFAPSSLDFKYDSKYDVIGTGGNSVHSVASTSSCNSNCNNKANAMEGCVGVALKHSVSSTSLVGMERNPSPTSTIGASGGQGHTQSQKKLLPPSSSPLTGDTIDQTLGDPMSHDAGTLANILTREPIYPSYMPHPTKSIVQGLCQKNVTQRLGTRRGGKGIEDIQMHIFFQDVEWSRLNQKLVQAPWVPPTMNSNAASSSTAVHHCAKYYPHYSKKQNIKEEELYGPTFSGYNCPDWNSFV